jgi:glutathione S-transferase
MPFVLYLHPLSSYSQKAKTAFYEKNLPFEVKLLDGSEPVASEFAAKWPIRRFPVLEHGGDFIFEATSIIEYIDMLHPGEQPLIPRDAATAIRVRMWDRFFDNYTQYPQQRMVNAALGREMEPDDGYVRWRQALETAYAILDRHMQGRRWAAGESFSLADCSAAPALLYADWAHPMAERFEHARAYRARLLQRPSYARALEEARPYRHLYPLGAPIGRD